MATAVKIGQAGEGIVVQWLKDNNYSILDWNTQAPGSTDIKASGGGKVLLVQVKAAVVPSQPASLSSDEEPSIKARAAQIKAEAYEAKVQLDSSLRLVGKIEWRQL